MKLCIEDRGVNNNNIKNTFPLNRFEDLLEGVRCPTVFSVIDLKYIYYHIEMDINSRQYRAFVYDTNKYKWNIINIRFFSIAAAMTSILKDFKTFVGVHYHDVIIFSQDRILHLEHLNGIFETFSEYGLKINFIKIKLCWEKLIFYVTL